MTARKFVAEMIGTALLVIVGVGVATGSFGFKLAGGSISAGVVTTVFLVVTIWGGDATWTGYVQATALASMAGGLADWFAVTALFRHPLGLPIPHTAIIPRRTDSIGASIGRFVEDNFLSEDVLISRMRALHVLQRAAGAIQQPEVSDQIAKHATTAINNNSANAGGGRVARGQQSYVVRGVGLVRRA